MTARNTNEAMRRRAQRVRRKLKKHAGGRPRLSVFRSGKNISVQIIDDTNGITLASASSTEKTLRDALGKGSTTAAAEEVGKLIAERAKKAKISAVVFDRGGYMFHGRVKALAQAARDGGLEF